MPSIFTDADKENIRTCLLTEGKRCMLENGVKQMNLEQLAYKVGIAKGTFYRFFPTKQHFILAILRRYQAQRAEVLAEEARRQNGSLTVHQALEMYLRVYDPKENPFFHMRDSDLDWISEKIPPEELFDPEMDLRCCGMILSCVRDLKKDIDLRVVSNFSRMVMFTLMQQNNVHQEVLPVNIRMIVDLIADYVTDYQNGGNSHEI